MREKTGLWRGETVQILVAEFYGEVTVQISQF